MCQPDIPATGRDEFVLDVPALRRMIGDVEATRRRLDDPAAVIAAIRGSFATLLADDDWLPEQYRRTSADSGMGSGIGMWLLYRSGDGGLALSSLVVPPGMQTPVHDHLAWGLVGLYQGEQEEDVFQRRDDGEREDRADLGLIEQNRLRPGDFYTLLPENDIHRVRTVSAVNSVSLHLLGNDNGCIWRHRFHPDEGRVEPFRSGYVNVACREAAPAVPA